MFKYNATMQIVQPYLIKLDSKRKWSHSGMRVNIAVGNRIFLGMQGFDFCPDLIKYYPDFPKFYPVYSNFAQILPKFFQCLPKLALMLPKFA